MKPLMPLISGMLIACLGCANAMASEKPAKQRAQVAKAPAGKVLKSASKNSSTSKLKAKRSRVATVPAAALPVSVAPEGVALALSTDFIAPPPAPASHAPVVTPRAYGVYVARSFGSGGDNPYLPKPALPASQAFAPIQAVPEATYPTPSSPELGNLLGALGQAIPILPDSGQSILPSIKKVYPTGEKPLVVVSFKCPTEVLGVTPPTIKLLHGLVDLGMEGINKSDLLSFNLQQVCQ